MVEIVKPFYMWAGGKTKLLKHYQDIWPTEEYNSYVDPFFGVVLFFLAEKRSS